MFTGKVEIKVVSADLTAFTEEGEDKYELENFNTYVSLEIDSMEIGTTETKEGTNNPEWEEDFATQNALGMNEIRITLFKDLGAKDEDEKIADCFVPIKELRAKGTDTEKIKFTQEMIPKGSVKLEIAFFPKENKLKRKPAVHEKVYLHQGHRYAAVFFAQPVFCAYCHKFIWGMFGKQGLTCQNCEMTVHNDHYNLGITRCTGVKGPTFENKTEIRDPLAINIPHNFKVNTFLGPTFCDHCGKPIWGVYKQGYQCNDCKFNAHKRCLDKFANNCGLDEKRFTDVMKNLDIDPSKAQSISDIPSQIPSTDPEALDKFAQVLRNLDDDPQKNGIDAFEDFKAKIREKVEQSELYHQAINKSKLEDFDFLKVLGEGAFGKVYLVEHKKTNGVFAAKVISKEQILRGNDVDVTMTERRILSLGTSKNFLTTLHSSFQTPDKLFFVMEYVSGGDLMFQIQKLGYFTPEQTRFYAGEILLALQFLHSKSIIYRDLKLDNVMLDKEGHIKLTDFGMCKEGIGRRDLTETFGGTPDYMAPEVIQTYLYETGGYGHSADWWSFGVLIYEMLAGGNPFFADGQDELFQQILHMEIRYPDHINEEHRVFISSLLERDPFQRLGCFPQTEQDIKDQPLFADIDWTALENREIEPPFKPNVNGDKDTSNFDEEFTNEDPHLTVLQKKKIVDFERFYKDTFTGFSFYNVNYEH
eukprot:GFUD01013064.1.p1 GENE.GFUD01013064.1~~GFUD01013064.1.p1  ORF type:complete len:700 (-),score=155.21 GFUD01013064.1:108-2207(-)